MKDPKEYIEEKIGMILATVAGHAIGVSFTAMQGKEYHYNHGNRIREMIRRDVLNIFHHGIKIGRKVERDLNKLNQ